MSIYHLTCLNLEDESTKRRQVKEHLSHLIFFSKRRRRYDSQHNNIQQDDTQHNIKNITTLSITTLSIVALNAVMLCYYVDCYLCSVTDEPLGVSRFFNVFKLGVIAPLR